MGAGGVGSRWWRFAMMLFLSLLSKRPVRSPLGFYLNATLDLNPEMVRFSTIKHVNRSNMRKFSCLPDSIWTWTSSRTRRRAFVITSHRVPVDQIDDRLGPSLSQPGNTQPVSK